jgi:hypothetical protein
MKKSLTILAIACILLIGSEYIFIPGRLVVTKVELVHFVHSAVYRTLANENKWQAWFPSEKKGSSSLIFKGDTFRVGKAVPFTVQVLLGQKDGGEIETLITVLNFPGDSAVIQWQCGLPAGLNPLKRFFQYLNARRIKNNMKEILDQFVPFVEQKEHVYGVNIDISSTKDTLLISTQNIQKTYPTTAEVYALIGKLRQYISLHQSSETGYPMLNIKQLDSGWNRVRVAIPIHKLVVDYAQIGKDGFSEERMVPGHFVTTQFTGGDSTVQEVFRQIRLYSLDYSKVPVAIPFQSLITERINEPDTSKWITRIFAPVY